MSRENGHAGGEGGDTQMIALTNDRLGPADQFRCDERTRPLGRPNNTWQIGIDCLLPIPERRANGQRQKSETPEPFRVILDETNESFQAGFGLQDDVRTVETAGFTESSELRRGCAVEVQQSREPEGGIRNNGNRYV